MSHTATRHLPILFSADMVRAILQSRKTQTRRLIKYGDIKINPEWFASIYPDGGGNWVAWSHDMPGTAEFTKKAYPNGEGFICPYGHPGDRLWVRETYQHAACFESNLEEYAYAADYSDLNEVRKLANVKWRPSIHMPRAASRITLDVRSIQPQRLHDISPADAIAEGIDSFRPVPGDGPPETLYRDYLADEKFKTGQPVRKYPFTSPIESYRTLWQKINGPQSWGLNPWVWVIQFRRLNT